MSVEYESVSGIFAVTFPLIKKRINAEKFIVRRAALYIGETQNRVATNKGDQRVGNTWLKE